MADPIVSLTLIQTIAALVSLIISGVVTYILVPPLIDKMKKRKITGSDWNKKDKPEIPELGGIAILFGFPVGISIAAGILKLFDVLPSAPILAAIGVIFIAGMIGIIDDISDISKKVKAFGVAFAALPLLLAGFGNADIALPFGYYIDLTSIDLVYWLILVPIGITGAANAMNMSAGYNGLETGQVAVISFSLLICAIIAGTNIQCILILSALLGASIGLNYFNGFPAVVFVGNVGTFALGAGIGIGAIVGGLEFAGIIAIAPAFYEVFATVYYSLFRRVDSESRKKAHSRPIIDEDGKLHAPKGAEKYKLSLLILGKKPMKEKDLVRTILSMYLIFGVIAIILEAL